MSSTIAPLVVALLVPLLPATAHATSQASSPVVPAPISSHPSPEPDTVARGQPDQHFGDAGTSVLSFSFDYGAANAGLPTQPLAFGVRPSLDTFVVHGLSLGAGFGFEVARQPGYSGDFYNVGGGPRVGYAFRLGERFVLWPKVFLSFDSGAVPTLSSTVNQGALTFNPNSATLEDLRVGVHIPFGISLSQHTLLELGPVLSRDLWRTVGGEQVAAVNLVELRAGIIGWF